MKWLGKEPNRNGAVGIRMEETQTWICTDL